jgi:hypothetical protein
VALAHLLAAALQAHPAAAALSRPQASAFPPAAFPSRRPLSLAALPPGIPGVWALLFLEAVPARRCGQRLPTWPLNCSTCTGPPAWTANLSSCHLQLVCSRACSSSPCCCYAREHCDALLRRTCRSMSAVPRIDERSELLMGAEHSAAAAAQQQQQQRAFPAPRRALFASPDKPAAPGESTTPLGAAAAAGASSPPGDVSSAQATPAAEARLPRRPSEQGLWGGSETSTGGGGGDRGAEAAPPQGMSPLTQQLASLVRWNARARCGCCESAMQTSQ